jgi:predicted O-methyltransferase YrrM
MTFNERWRTESEALLRQVEARTHIPAEQRGVALNRAHAEVLVSAMLEYKPKRTLEIGLGYGFSAACIQAAGSKDHTIVSFDMNPARYECGVRNSREFGSPRILYGASDATLASLIASEGETYGLVLIDGGHNFDTAFVDLHFARQLCAIGGIILIDDTWMPAIRTLCSWIETNLQILRPIAHVDCVSAFQLEGLDMRSWDHWRPFQVAS